jgi:2,5-diketo-D-gluconate reductase A
MRGSAAEVCPVIGLRSGGIRRPPIGGTRLDTVSQIPTISLNDGASIPQLGFGTYKIAPDQAASAVRTALDVGYRHIDTAQMYRNEKGVGEAIRESGIDRAEVFVTSKLNNGFHKPDDARRAFDGTLAALGFDYVDLFLIHWPLPTRYDGDFVSTWRTLEEFKSDGRARSIGVSNFQVSHLQRLARETETTPAVNQVEVHPYFANAEVRDYDREHGIVTEAWAPIARGTVVDDPAVTRIAAEVGKSAAQVVLRWHIQRGDVVFPKSVTPQRIKENFGIFDFELGDAEMAALSALDKGEAGRTGPNPDQFDNVDT